MMTSRQYNANEDRSLLGNTRSYFSHFVRPSRSSSREDSRERDSSSNNTIGPNAVQRTGAEANEKISSAVWSKDWIPYTFTHPFFGVTAFVALTLCVVSFLLWWRSSTNYGLGPDDGSSTLLFGWRYSPTLIAVIYVQMTTVLLEDVKRTEPYARLARPNGAEASCSILKAPGAWWDALYDGFAKKRNGGRSLILICASAVNIIGFLAISSLSSAFLFSEEIVVPKSVEFFSLAPAASSPLPIDADRTTHFRTIANLLQNVSTSPWITDNYTILPFWPAELNPAPITSLPISLTQEWTAKTVMFKSDLACTAMTLEKKASGSVQYSSGWASLSSNSTIWSSPDGCKYGMSAESTFWNTGGGSWSDASTFYYALSPLLQDGGLVSSSNQTSECDGRQIILVTESWEMESPAFSAQICDTRYYMANITASVSLTGDVPDISFEESEFERNKVAIPDTVLNTTTMRNLTLDASWPNYMLSILLSGTAALGGPSVLLGALYDYNMTALVNDPNWVASAATANQRYFGEVLQAALTRQGASQRTPIQGTLHDVETRVVVQAGSAVALGVLFAISFLLLLAVWWCSQLRRRPLNLKEDPASTLGVAALIAPNARVSSGFQTFRQPSAKDLHGRLKGQRFFTDSYGLSRISPDEILHHDVAQSENGTPKLLRLPALVALVVVLIAVVVGVCVLWHFAETVGLYEKAFVYQVDLSFLSNSVSSVAPISMVPTLVATIIGLWWSAIDDNFRRLQPYLAMSDGHPPIPRGTGLSYQSSFWLWACIKAALNKHWLLSLLTLGSTLTPIFTTTMSAIFDRGPGVVIQPITFDRSLEIRKIPFVFGTQQAIYPDSSNDYVGVILSDLYKNISTYWMYTATIQLALNGSEPAWSKDGWSFVPAEMNTISSVALPNDLDDSDKTVLGAQSNVTFTTPAMRARIECFQYPAQALTNLSNWLTPVDLSNATTWNQSTIPHGIRGGYELGTSWIYRESPSVILPLTEDETISTCRGCTTVFVNPNSIACCGNSSSSAWDPSVAVGYWSPNTNLSTWSTRYWDQNFTVKWFQGNAVTGITANPVGGYASSIPLLFPTPPSITLMNCRPMVESANANVTVNPANGVIQSFNITTQPKEMVEAFTDNFLPHNQTRFSSETAMVYYNVTVSYGRLFMASMLTAADTLHLDGAEHVGGYHSEDLNDNTYNIRDEINGLNMDFMSYAMYSMAGKDPQALLDPDRYLALAQKTFTTFFQHFVSNNISMETGGWGYQQINASLPDTLGPVLEMGSYLPSTKAAAYQDDMHPISHTNRTVAAHVSQRVELLQMNAVAVWLSIAIMAWLILTTLVVAILHKRYFGRLVRNVECLGDVLVLIAGSANLLEVVREIQAGRLSPDEYEHLRTRLGWFVDEDGGLRWGVEMEEAFRDGPGVQWVAAPYFSKKGTNTWNMSDNERDS
ncbi:uncharacterized protein N7482_000596 [Penicillium canariense]|uniref:Uncharacterized protein n=1 Tax=Penicillium canariense TaxID=189055 RepID=A0A9W9IEF9_9EURO|nr:uncharacterized protein N7482_000596 [Penicillium canariense]KAJ5174719.1 hypothetical protein N7482_000596 [Penicillium canariense]